MIEAIEAIEAVSGRRVEAGELAELREAHKEALEVPGPLTRLKAARAEAAEQAECVATGEQCGSLALPIATTGTGLCPLLQPCGSAKRTPRREIIQGVACANVVEAQGATPRPDIAYNCAPSERLSVAVDVPV